MKKIKTQPTEAEKKGLLELANVDAWSDPIPGKYKNATFDDYYLPGTSLTAIEGEILFAKYGVGVGEDDYGRFVMGDFYNNPLLDFTDRETYDLLSINSHLQKISTGAFNSAFEMKPVTEDEKQEYRRMLDRLGIIDEPTSLVLRRTTPLAERDSTNSVSAREAWFESMYAVIAGIVGLGPRVFGSTYYPSPDDDKDHMHIMLMEQGIAFNTIITRKYDDEMGFPNSYSAKLAALFKKSGELRLLLIDIKSPNMIAIRKNPDDVEIGDGMEFRFIDFDPGNTVTLPETSAECVEFLNIVMFLAYEYRYASSPNHQYNAARFTEAMRVRLEGHLTSIESSELSRRSFAVSLCSALTKMSHKKSGMSVEPILEAIRDDPETLAKQVLSVSKHYLKPFKPYKGRPDAPFDVTNDVPWLTQVARRVLEVNRERMTR